MGRRSDANRELAELREAVSLQRGRCEFLEHRLAVASGRLAKAKDLIDAQDAVIELLDRENEEMAGKLYGAAPRAE